MGSREASHEATDEVAREAAGGLMEPRGGSLAVSWAGSWAGTCAAPVMLQTEGGSVQNSSGYLYPSGWLAMLRFGTLHTSILASDPGKRSMWGTVSTPLPLAVVALVSTQTRVRKLAVVLFKICYVCNLQTYQ